jgi:dTDP-4-amino-4,6-dideoxygalactose transaminase
VNGTNSLLTALHCLDVGVGDEVIVSPYTFIATYNVVLNSVALPVFADTDPETFLINPDKIEEKINENTRAILPVHIFGLPVNMGKINAIAKKRNLKVIEDACQAWLAEWDGKKCGTLGDLGCFSFQESKHLPAGEGGAVVGNDEELMDRVWSYHNCGRPYRSVKGKTGYPMAGNNRRMTEYQAAILLNQMQRLEAETADRADQGHSGHRAAQALRRGDPSRLSPVPDAVQAGAVRRFAEESIPRRSERRRHSLLQCLWSPVQRRADRGRIDVQEFQAGLPEGEAGPVSR